MRKNEEGLLHECCGDEWRASESFEPHGFACLPPAVPKELVPDKQRLSSSWVPTAITTEKAFVKVRKTGEASEKCNS